MFKQQFITVSRGLVACIYSADSVVFRTSKNGQLLKTLAAAEAAQVVVDLKGFNAKSILTAAFAGRALVA